MSEGRWFLSPSERASYEDGVSTGRCAGFLEGLLVGLGAAAFVWLWVYA